MPVPERGAFAYRSMNHSHALRFAQSVRLTRVLVAAALMATSACRRNEPASANDLLSPMETARRIHELRNAGSFSELGRYLLAEQREVVLSVLRAVDHLAAADQQLRSAVESQLGPADVADFDHSDLVNSVGLFSRDLAFIEEEINGEEAGVIIQVADRLPLERAQFVRRDGAWRVRTDSPIPEMPGEIERLAEILTDEASRLRERQLSAAQLRKELDSRILAAGRRLDALTRRSGESASTSVQGDGSPPD